MSINWPSIVVCGVFAGFLAWFLDKIGADPEFGIAAGALLAVAWVQTFKPFRARR